MPELNDNQIFENLNLTQTYIREIIRAELDTISDPGGVVNINNKITDMYTHLSNENNPHKVTKEQVGLGNADNTKDIDKPISRLVQTALDNKVSLDDLKSLVNGIINDKYDDTDIKQNILTLTNAVASKVAKDIFESALANKADKSQIVSINEIQQKIDAVSGGYFKAVDTLNALKAETIMQPNQIAKVVNDPVAENNGEYYYNGSNWVKGFDYTTYLKALLLTTINKHVVDSMSAKTLAGNKMIFGFADEDNYVIANIDNKGNINANNLNNDIDSPYAIAFTDEDNKAAIAVTKAGTVLLNGIEVASGGNFPFAFTDGAGNLSFAIDKKGNLVSPTIEIIRKQISNVKNDVTLFTDKFTDNNISFQNTDYKMVIGYGQSLSRGAGSFPIISTKQPYQNVMFKSGVLTRFMDAHDFSDFAPLIEVDNGQWEGETPMSALANTTTSAYIKEGKRPEDYKFLVTSSGMGGQRIEVLSKGNSLYTGMLEQVKSAVTVANNKGGTVSVWAVTWTQGEDNYANNTTKADYYNMLKKLHDDISVDVKSLTGQDFAPIMIMYQVTSHRKYGRDDNQIAIAQYETCENFNSMIMATPIYFLNHVSDDLHLTADSSYQLGKYYSQALKYVIDTGKKWQPLKPKHVLGQKRIIDIEMNKSGLVFDTTTVNRTHNLGFDIFNVNGELVNIIENVSIEGDNRVKIKLNQDLPKDCYLCYAKGRSGDPNIGGPVEGPRGNLRDNADTVGYQDSTGSTRYMNNWCVAFKIKIS